MALTEDKPDQEPAGIIDTRRGRNVYRTAQEHGDVDVLETRIREPALPPPEWEWEERANK